jgi:hypothetical protein
MMSNHSTYKVINFGVISIVVFAFELGADFND